MRCVCRRRPTAREILVSDAMRESENAPIGIAGAGRIGQALGRLLREHGQPVVAIASRSAERAAAGAAFIGKDVEAVAYERLPGYAGRILIAVPDDAVPSVATVLAKAGMRGGMAAHTSGALEVDALAPLVAAGVSCAALHPLQTVATPEQGLSALPGSAFAIGGGGPALRWAKQMVSLMEGQPLRIRPGRRPLYHAAAVMASNYLVGLIDAAVILMSEAGIEEREALRAIAPLVRASAENALTLGAAKALTGPIERGDGRTVAAHLTALAGAPESIGELYRRAGLHVLELARRKNPLARLEELETLLRREDSRNG